MIWFDTIWHIQYTVDLCRDVQYLIQTYVHFSFTFLFFHYFINLMIILVIIITKNWSHFFLLKLKMCVLKTNPLQPTFFFVFLDDICHEILRLKNTVLLGSTVPSRILRWMTFILFLFYKADLRSLCWWLKRLQNKKLFCESEN